MTIAFTLPGGQPVYTFSLLIGIGATLGVGRLAVTTPPETLRAALVSAGFILTAALAGARLFYQFNHPAAPLGLPIAGLSWIGAWIGGLAAFVLISGLTVVPAGVLADALVPVAAALTAAAWLGCWLDGCAYGAVSDAWFSLVARDEWGNIAGRVPVQLLGAILAVATLALFDYLRSYTHQPGQAASLWLRLTGVEFIWLQSLRADPRPAWAVFDPNILAAFGLLFFGLAFALFLRFKPK